MKIVTFNLRCVYIGDGVNGFVHRAGLIYEKVMQELPDVIAFQEVTQRQLPLLERLFPEYLFVGGSRTPDFEGEGLYTAIRRASCTVHGFDFIWLSPTPLVPGSRFPEQSACPRILLDCLVREKATNRLLHIYNVHLDHVSDAARILGIKCAFSRIGEKSADGYPYILLGDFNARPDSETIAFCNAREELVELTKNISATFHGYGKMNEKIDYIYASRPLAEQATEAVIWDDCQSGIYLSDHYPIAVTL